MPAKRGFPRRARASIGLDIRRLGWPLSVLRLGASIIQGDNISGWSIVLGYKF